MTSLKGLAVFASLLFAFYLLPFSAPGGCADNHLRLRDQLNQGRTDCGRDYHLRDRHAQNPVE